jgi:lipid A 4'-phosphatase
MRARSGGRSARPETPRGTCNRNCSFVSGEVSSAAWTIAPAILVPGPLRYVAIGGAFVFTIVIAVVRMAAGGHFFSDAVFAALFTALIVWLTYRLIYLPSRFSLSEAALDQALVRCARAIRRAFGAA